MGCAKHGRLGRLARWLTGGPLTQTTPLLTDRGVWELVGGSQLVINGDVKNLLGRVVGRTFQGLD